MKGETDYSVRVGGRNATEKGEDSSICATCSAHLLPHVNFQYKFLCERRLNSGNACYHSAQSLLSFRLSKKNLKMRIYKIIILSVILYGCETWSLTLRVILYGCEPWSLTLRVIFFTPIQNHLVSDTKSDFVWV
jgi:hypothetical protein